jgi:hypothetical protein
MSLGLTTSAPARAYLFREAIFEKKTNAVMPLSEYQETRLTCETACLHN